MRSTTLDDLQIDLKFKKFTYVGIQFVQLVGLILQLLLEVVDALLVHAIFSAFETGRARLDPAAGAFALKRLICNFCHCLYSSLKLKFIL